MVSATRNSSSQRFYIPGSADELRRRRWKVRDERTAREAFVTLNLFVTKHGGWIVSLPGDRMVTLEVLPESSLPADLRARGYQLEEIEGGERIVPAGHVEDVLTERSTKVAFRTAHAAVRRVARFTFQL
jgi:hypothetical protein